MTDLINKVASMIDRASVSIISSVSEEGFPNTKAMLPPRKREGIKNFYFTTNTSSIRVRQYLENPKACVYFYERIVFSGVMLVGTMEVLQDAKSKEMIWEEGDDSYYPGGVTDPDYCVLKFTARNGRFYSNLASEDLTVE
ncbi:MAG: pyridoxamine 5'-phosphate oxidase family protein [Gammaproteobacteria bacterium]|nr:pyridoxamine 5'-phosphate oxidase family protein [Gammaproteobacteria bacterium]